MILSVGPALPKKQSQVQASKFVFAESSYGIVKRIQVIDGWINRVMEQTGKPRLMILDYGCGTGNHVTIPLAQMGHEVLGIDSHESSIREARHMCSLPNLSFQTGALDDLLKENKMFELIVCSEVLEHHDKPFDFLVGLRRLLGRDGMLIITTPNGYGSYEMLCRLERELRTIGVHQWLRSVFYRGQSLIRLMSQQKMFSSAAHVISEDQTPGFLNVESVHVQFFRLQALEQLFRKSGFRVVSRRARTFLCGPYVDVLFNVCPFRQLLFRINNRLADLLPFRCAADWMFLLKPDTHTEP